MTTKKYVPPPAVRTAAKKGLALRKKFGRGGTAVGLARGRQLASQKSISEDVVKRMYSYFARHAVDKKGKNFFSPTKPSNGFIAWHLWGGDPGAKWVYALRRVRTCSRGHTYRGTGSCPRCWQGSIKT